MYLLDTNVISELRKGKAGGSDRRVSKWVGRIPTSSTFLSVISVLELERGTLLMERRDITQGDMLRSWLDGQVWPAFAGRILPVDAAIARRCAALHVPNPNDNRDSLIAATAMVHGLTVVTRNTAHFERTGVAVLNPWEA